MYKTAEERSAMIKAAMEKERARTRALYAEHQANLQAWKDFHATKHWVPNLRVHDMGSEIAELAESMEARLGKRNYHGD